MLWRSAGKPRDCTTDVFFTDLEIVCRNRDRLSYQLPFMLADVACLFFSFLMWYMKMTCKVCQGKIPPNVLHFPEGSQFGGPKHVACVRCVWCQGPLGANGATEFYPHEGDIYCSSICLSSKLAIARGSGPPRTDLAWKGPASQSGEGSTQVAASTTAGPFLASAATPTPTSVTAPALASVASPAPTSAAVSFRSLVVITPKFDVCLRCQKKVYQYELVKVNGTIFHKFCLRCKVCSTTLNVKSAEMLGSEVYCKVHLPGNKALGSATVN